MTLVIFGKSKHSFIKAVLQNSLFLQGTNNSLGDFHAGYTYRYPFLDEEGLGLDFGPMRRYVAPLYQHVIHAKHDSSLTGDT